MMGTVLMSTISFGFDIATAISIIGGVIAFIYNSRKMNKADKGEERERERVIKLTAGLEGLNKLIQKYISVAKKEEEPLKTTFEEINDFLNNNLWQTFLLFANKKDIKEIESMMTYLESCVDNANNNIKHKPKEFAFKIVNLEKVMLLQLRRLMNNESEDESAQLVSEYYWKKYGIEKKI